MLTHAFLNALLYLDRDRRGFDYRLPVAFYSHGSEEGDIG